MGKKVKKKGRNQQSVDNRQRTKARERERESKIVDIYTWPPLSFQWSSIDDFKGLSQMDPSFVIESIENFKDVGEL